MRIRGFIELTPRIDDELLRQLLWVADRTSRTGKVILALNEIPVRVVSRYVDPVAQFGSDDESGLRYRPMGEIDDALLDVAQSADFVIADSSRLSESHHSRGVLHMRSREGVRYLHSLFPPGDRHAAEDHGFLAAW